MKIAIHTLGTRGDVQPYIALALGLRRAGHDVLLAAPAQFSDLAASHGIGFAALPAEFLQMLDDPEFKGAVARGVGPGSILKLLKRFLRGWQKRTFGPGSTARRTRRSSRTAATLYGYSPSVVPVPREWNSDVLVSGYWFLDESRWKPSPALASFLAAGPPPVYVGFGSMPIADAAAMTGVVVEALNISGRRGVLAAGWGGLGGRTLPASVHLLDSAPHDQLFPLMSIVVHHGGAGTTAAGLRAGKPNVICPFLGDQPFWGRRVAMLGAGPSPLPAKQLSSQQLATALDAADDPGMRANARKVGEKISAERGIETAVAFIERYAGSGKFSNGGS